MSAFNGQRLDQGPPSLGFTLSTALLMPGFVEQALGLTDLFVHVDDTQITPLDDLKEWMRSDPWRAGELFETCGELLLGEERRARKAADKAGAAFDLVEFELAQMDGDATYESFDPAWAARLLRLAVEEADAVQQWSRRAHGVDFALAASFQLPDPRKHTRFSRESIAEALLRDALEPVPGSLAAAVAAGRPAHLELSGAFQMDLSAPGGGPSLARSNGVGFVRVPCADPRAGDETVAHLSLAYPLEAEGYFTKTFEALRQDLALKPGPQAA
jgi:hypothetical protein